MQRLKTLLQMAAIIISMMGIITFSLFITEEAFQTIMFGTWPAQDAKEWRIVKRGITGMKSAVFTMKVINWGFGYLQPFGFFAYNSYIQAAEFYIEGLSAKVFAFCPECYDGEEFEFTFRPQRVEDGTAISNNLVVVYPDSTLPSLDPVVVRGLVRAEGDRVRVQAIDVKAVGSQKQSQ
uniref:Uncharacterized protein n=1 Tax=viral metagenome TaxID=1070528 RepID=A0A6M3KVR3_9ZZZZ